MSEALRLCSLSVCRQPAPAAGSCRSAGGSWGWGYELLLQQDLEDGVYHEPGESAHTLRLQVGRCSGWGTLGCEAGLGCACWLHWHLTCLHARLHTHSEHECFPRNMAVLQVSDIVALEWETTQSLNQGDNEYRPALVLHVFSSGGTGIGAAPSAAGDDTASKQLPGTPPSTGARPGSSRASARRPPAGRGKDPAAAGSGAAAADGAGMPSPVAGTPQGPPAPRGGSGGVGGSIRRCAVMCNPLHSADEDDAEEHLSAGSSSSAGSQDGANSENGSSSDGEDASPVAAARVAAQEVASSSRGGLQQEWQLLGELEYVLRLCILEGREQAAHQEVTVRLGAACWLGWQAGVCRLSCWLCSCGEDAGLCGLVACYSHAVLQLPCLQDERILMAFQVTSVPPAAASGAQHVTGGGSTLRQQGRSSKVRWRSAAAGAAPPPSAGVNALTAGVRQLSFTPGAPAAAAAGAPSAAGESGSTAGTRRGGRPRGRGFGSPVQ